MPIEAATQYHHGAFPPSGIDIAQHLQLLLEATQGLARYDERLQALHNKEIFLAPLRDQDALLSSRMEGTVSTMDEILEYSQDDTPPPDMVTRNDALETVLYRRALRKVHDALKDGYKLSPLFIRTMHQQLLASGRGATKSPGQFKRAQNFLANGGDIVYVPIAPELLDEGLERLFEYVDHGEAPLLIRTAITHLEFEALHPFQDGNGRIGRMLIPLQLWLGKHISSPYFYMSRYFEEHKEEYLQRMRAVSAQGEWNEWVAFFLRAVSEQARMSIELTDQINSCYREVKERIEELHSIKSISLLDFLFTRPVFRNTQLVEALGQSPSSVSKITQTLIEQGILHVKEPARGRKAALYTFEPLMEIIRI